MLFDSLIDYKQFTVDTNHKDILYSKLLVIGKTHDAH